MRDSVPFSPQVGNLIANPDTINEGFVALVWSAIFIQ